MKTMPIIWGTFKRSWRGSEDAQQKLELASLTPSAAQSYWGGVHYGTGACRHNQHGTRQKNKGPGVSFPEICPLILIFDCHGKAARGTCNYNNWKKDTMTMGLPGYLRLARDHINFMNLQRNVVPGNTQNSCLYCLFCLNSLPVRVYLVSRYTHRAWACTCTCTHKCIHMHKLTKHTQAYPHTCYINSYSRHQHTNTSLNMDVHVHTVSAYGRGNINTTSTAC